MFDGSPSVAAPDDAKAALPASAGTPGSADEAPARPGYVLENYDPSEYRWVPVRRRPRADGWTEEKQRRFIEVLADTGLVSAAAREVGLSREAAYQLRRSAHGAAFARAWDTARRHAGSFVEDVVFERAIEGVEHPVFNEYGEVVCTKRVPDNRLLMYLLKHLKPERYMSEARREASPPVRPELDSPTIDAALREMEPQPPAPAEQLLNGEALGEALRAADDADGVLPEADMEQPPKPTAAELEAAARVASDARGAAVWEALINQDEPDVNALSDQDVLHANRLAYPSLRNAKPRRLFK